MTILMRIEDRLLIEIVQKPSEPTQMLETKQLFVQSTDLLGGDCVAANTDDETNKSFG